MREMVLLGAGASVEAGVPDNGLNDPGVETFKGDFDRYLARELGQNSLDARHDKKKPVQLKFDLLQIDREEVPGMDFLQDVFARSAKFWSHGAKAKCFFKNAEKLATALFNAMPIRFGCRLS